MLSSALVDDSMSHYVQVFGIAVSAEETLLALSLYDANAVLLLHPISGDTISRIGSGRGDPRLKLSKPFRIW